MWFKKKKNNDVSTCELSDVMEGAMSIQGKALVNQTELNVAYQAYSLLRWKDGKSHDVAAFDAAKILVDLEMEIKRHKEKLEYEN